MSVTPQGDRYPHPWGGWADRVTRVASLVDGGDINGLIGWAVNQGAMGAIETISEWALLPSIYEQYEVAKKRGHELRRNAGTKGTKTHQIIAKVIDGSAQPWQLELVPLGLMEAFHRFLTDVEPLALDAERTVYGTFDSKYWFAGTIDLVCRINKTLTYIDWKTGSRHLAYTAQLGGYGSCAFWSNDGTELLDQIQPQQLLAVYLNESGTYVVENIDLDYAKTLWIKSWDLFRLIREKEDKVND